MSESDNNDNKTHLANTVFDPICVRKKSNISKTKAEYRFDVPTFSPSTLLKDIPIRSPKLESLLKNISDLDKKDMKKHGKLFKHFVFSDLKSSSSGAKLLASALIANGMHSGYTAKIKNSKAALESSPTNEKPVPIKYDKIELLSDEELQKTPNNNIYLLSSVGVYDQSITVTTKKDILKKFNQRPENIHGELIRFIVMDSGFKEGIDLFDIKYIHIFEPSTVSSDQKQVIGRGTRTCGQRGLEFHPTRGWGLHVFVYDLEIPKELQYSLLGAKTAIELYLSAMNLDIRLAKFTHELEKTSVLGSIDYELNKNIHMFSIPNEDSEEEQGRGQEDDVEYIYGGKKLRIRKDIPKKVVYSDVYAREHGIEIPSNKMTFAESRALIHERFNQFEWEKVKMENLCADKIKGGSGDVIKYTPTQDFIRHYFTPECPVKGLLLHHSVGTGKTCSAIAAATTTFEPAGYTILWVTRTTLKTDIWKNMFDQVCNEDLRQRIVGSGLTIPTDNKQRMKLLSKSWRIRPMSYKQFSNLIAKRNSFYKTLVKINGAVDPLRKTLLIIDEAHKLYGGSDLSSLEQPDMVAFHEALMNSYTISGRDSVRIMLMTATPITQNPMELIQLLNLCKMPDNQMPGHFDDFSEKYLNSDGLFTAKGEKEYLDHIAGHISYLNREKDARQFAQPILKHIEAPIIENLNDVIQFDKKATRQYFQSNIQPLKNKIIETNGKIKKELKDVDSSTFNFLLEKCNKSEDPKKCRSIVNRNIRELVKDAKSDVSKIKEEIKELRENIKNKRLFRSIRLAQVSENIQNKEEKYEQYKTTMYHNILNDCSKPIRSPDDLEEHINKDKDVTYYDSKIHEFNERIGTIEQSIKMTINISKNRIKQLKALLKTDLSELEASVIKLTIAFVTKEARQALRKQRKESRKAIQHIKDDIQSTRKLRAKQASKVRKSLKADISREKKELIAIERAETKLRKTLRKQGELREEVKDETLQKLVLDYSQKIDKDLEELFQEKHEKEAAKLENIAMKEVAKKEKIAKKEQAKLEKEQAKLEKNLMKENTRKQRELAKQERKLNKTKKNSK
jgi:hypothetical protein